MLDTGSNPRPDADERADCGPLCECSACENERAARATHTDGTPECGIVDLSSAPAGAITDPANGETHIVTQADIDAAKARAAARAGLTLDELEAVYARRALQGPNERAMWEREARRILARSELPPRRKQGS